MSKRANARVAELVRLLPKEYRLLGLLELQALRQRLDDLLPEPAMAQALAVTPCT
jgi:hypothetical protein